MERKIIEFFLNVFTEFRGNFEPANTGMLRKHPQVTKNIFKWTRIHVSVIYQIP